MLYKSSIQSLNNAGILPDCGKIHPINTVSS
jgi:hypothetical protein